MTSIYWWTIKGVYSYGYMNSFGKLSKDKLPDRCEFFSSLKDECISQKGYLYEKKKKKSNRWLSWSLIKNKCFLISWFFWKVF